MCKIYASSSSLNTDLLPVLNRGHVAQKTAEAPKRAGPFYLNPNISRDTEEKTEGISLGAVCPYGRIQVRGKRFFEQRFSRDPIKKAKHPSVGSEI